MVQKKPSPQAAGRATGRAVGQRPILQWATAIAGVLLTAGVAGVILAEALEPTRPVALAVEVDGMRRTPSGWIVDLRVSNAGSETAAGVEITGAASGHTATVTLDYVPGDGEAEASLAFAGGARPRPVLAVTGWSRP